MQYFGSNIKIDGSDLADLIINVLGAEREQKAKQEAAKYEEQIHNLLLQINRTKTGNALLQAISRLAHKKMIIKPKIEISECDSPDKVNAFAKAVNLNDSVKKGVKLWDKNGFYNGAGTGLGSDTLIHLTPNEWLSNDIKGILGLNPSPGFSADDLLVHEMVHGLRIMAGVNNQKKVAFQKKLVKFENNQYQKEECRDVEKIVEYKNVLYVKKDCYPNIEEWFAVLIQNIYRSECKKILRMEYSTTFGNFTDRQFVRKGMNRSHLRQLRREHREMFSGLRDIEIGFNPTRLLLSL